MPSHRDTRQFGVNTLILAVCSAFSLAIAAPPAQGQAIEEITVTASKRSENLQEVPTSISAITGDNLAEMGALDLDDYIRSLPGVQFQNEGPGRNKLSIRGVASFFGTSGATVGYYIDETPTSQENLNIDSGTFDIERVEVLRGPQGTLYGEGSMGGTIRIITKKPDTYGFEAEIASTLSSTEDGGFNYLVNSMVNVPLVEDKLAVRAVLGYRDDAGYIDNVFTGNDDVNVYENLSGRVALRWDVTNDLSITGTAHFGDIDAGSAFTIANKNREIASNTEGTLVDEYTLFNVTVEYALPFADFVSSSSQYDRELGLIEDTPGQILPLFRLAPFPLPRPPFSPFPTSVPYTNVMLGLDRDTDTFTQEARLVSAGDGPFKWTIGVFYQDQVRTEMPMATMFGATGAAVPNAEYSFLSALLTGGFLSADTLFDQPNQVSFDKLAGFGEASYDFNEHWQVLVGARIFREKRETRATLDGFVPLISAFLGGTPPFVIAQTLGVEQRQTASDTEFNPKVTLTYNLHEEALAYFTYSTGFRSGGENPFAPFFSIPVQSSYQPETLENFELGVKAAFADGRMFFNSSAFLMLWDFLQVGVAAEGPFNAIGNVAQAKTAGVEFDIKARPVDMLDLGFGGAYIEAEVDKEITTGTFAGLAKGATLPSVPKWALNGYATYRWMLTNGWEVSLGGNFSWTGKTKRELRNVQTENPSYELVNLNAAVRGETWDVTFFVRNVTDTKNQSVYIRETATSGLWTLGTPNPNAILPAANIVPGDIVLTVQPRTFGVSLSKRF